VSPIEISRPRIAARRRTPLRASARELSLAADRSRRRLEAVAEAPGASGGPAVPARCDRALSPQPFGVHMTLSKRKTHRDLRPCAGRPKVPQTPTALRPAGPGWLNPPRLLPPPKPPPQLFLEPAIPTHSRHRPHRRAHRRSTPVWRAPPMWLGTQQPGGQPGDCVVPQERPADASGRDRVSTPHGMRPELSYGRRCVTD